LKINKILLVKLYIYHIEIQRASYNFINLLYATYYKAIRNKDFVSYEGYFDIHNSDVFILIYLFILIFFSKIITTKIVRQSVLNFYLKDKSLDLNKNYYVNGLLSFIENKKIKNKKIKKFVLVNKFKGLLLNKLTILENLKIKKNVNFSFFDFILYLCRKIEFQKFNNSFDFEKK
jgi:hypothetical protein